MTDVPPNDGAAPAGPPEGRGAYPPAPSGPPPAFDDDALAAALEADIATYTQPLAIVPPAPPTPVQSPAYETEYEAPDVPEYVVPPAPPVPDYVVPPAPESAPLFPVPEERPAATSGPSTLDAIQRLQEELERRGLNTGEQPVSPPAAPAAAPPPAPPAPTWEPALDHPAPGHVFPAPYAPFSAPVPDQGAAPESREVPEPPAAPEPPGFPPSPPAPAPAAPSEPQPPTYAAPPQPWPSPQPGPPPLVEPPVASGAAAPPPPTEGASYVAPTVLPPIREVRLEDVQGLPPPIGQQAAPLPPYDPNVPTVSGAPDATGASAPQFGAAPVAPPPSVPPFAATPGDAGTLPPPPIAPNEFGGEYGTPVVAPEPSSAPWAPDPAAMALGATEPESLDRDDDVVDDIDRVFGATPAPEGPAAGFASQPIPTQRVAENQPGLVDQRPENHPVFVVENAGTEPTALDLRAGRAARLFWLWFAANSSILRVAIGAVLLALGMSLRQAIVATLAGIALSFLPLGLGTLAGKWSGQPTMVVSRATFGHIGNILPAVLAVLTRVFWGAVLLWLLAVSAARLLVFAGLDAGLGETVWTFVVLGLGFVIAGVIALFGYGFVARLQLVLSIVSGLLVAGLIYLTLPRLDLGAALGVADGPWTLVLGGAIVVFSFVGLAWVQSSSDIARYQRPSSSGAQTMLWASVGATLPAFALIVWGAMLAASDPVLATGLSTSPLPTLARLLPLWYPAPLLAAAGLGLLSSIVLAIYSGGFALQAVGITARRNVTTAISSVLVAVLAAGLVVLAADAFSIARDLATTLAVPTAAWAGIFSAEMMIRTRRFDSPSLVTRGGVYPQVRVVNLIGFVVITAIGFGLSSATFPGLTWQGFLFPLLGVPADGPIATSDVGVLVALVLGIIVPLATAIPAIRKQERDSLYLEHTGPIPRQTGSIPRQTGSVPRQTGSVPRPTGSVPMPPPGGGAPS